MNFWLKLRMYLVLYLRVGMLFVWVHLTGNANVLEAGWNAVPQAGHALLLGAPPGNANVLEAGSAVSD